MTEPDAAESPLVQELDEVRAALNRHPGMIAWDNWYALRQTFEAVWAPNQTQLLHLLRLPSDNEDLAMEMMQGIRPPLGRERFNGEVARLLHNYCASSATLIDHSRRVVDRYGGSAFAAEYDERKTAVAQSCEASFIKGLRNFMLHRRLPAAGQTVTVTNAADGTSSVEVEIHLSVSQLLAWPKWGAPARILMETAGRSVALLPIVIRHGDLVKGLMAWMMSQFGPLHDDDLEAANTLVTKHNELMRPASDSRPLIIKLGGKVSPGEILANRATFTWGR